MPSPDPNTEMHPLADVFDIDKDLSNQDRYFDKSAGGPNRFNLDDDVDRPHDQVGGAIDMSPTSIEDEFRHDGWLRTTKPAGSSSPEPCDNYGASDGQAGDKGFMAPGRGNQ